MAERFKVEGLKELKQHLDSLALEARTLGTIFKPALEEAMTIAHNQIDPHIPVDTGTLKATHTISRVRKKFGSWIITDSVSSPDGDKALAQEFGNARTAPNPFIVNNFSAAVPAMLSVFKDQVAAAIEAVAKGKKPPLSQVGAQRKLEAKLRREARKAQHGPSRQTLNAAKRAAKKKAKK